MARHRVATAAASALLMLLSTATPAAAAPAPPPTTPAEVVAASVESGDVRHLRRTDVTENGRPVEVPDRYTPPRTESRSAAVTPAVGTVRKWYALDDVDGTIYRKDFTLRGVGERIEVWVADDLAFPAGDCRGTGSVRVTDAQVAALITEFDTTMYPRLTSVFGTPPDRDGSNAVAYGDFRGAGGRTVTLVDNIRDENYFSFPEYPTYTAGFFLSTFNELMDRNIMTIDSYDWLHRTGAHPVDAPTADVCTSRTARPRLYEGVFAHEWQHLLHYYTDAGEVSWLNEGLSDWAQTVVGYADGTRTAYDRGGDSHLYCYQGFGPVRTPYNANPRDCGGPQNSLNLWAEGGPNGVLADYGIAYQLMVFLADRYGPHFLTWLHRDGERQGLASLAAALALRDADDVRQVLHDFQTMTLVDRIVGDGRAGGMLGVPASRVTSPGLRSTVNLANPHAYAAPGAAPNGADYLLLGRGDDLRSVIFHGDATLPSSPAEVTPTPVEGWNLRLVGIDAASSRARQIDYGVRRSVTLSRHRLALLAEYPTVVAIVAYDEPTEQVQRYAPYTLTVNGVVQPGGR